MTKSLISILVLLTPAAASAYQQNWGLKSANIVNATLQARPYHNIVKVAVVDTGVDGAETIDFTNPYGALQPGELHLDSQGHGTHVAGIIRQINPEVSLISLKFYSDSGEGRLKHSIAAFRYALAHGARVINYSGGGSGFNVEEYAVLRQAEAQGVLVICAAGNDGQDLDAKGNAYYPASYRLSNIIAVASYGADGGLAASSNYGRFTATLAAPGVGIYSDLPGGNHGEMSGTSQATAFVTGAASLIWRVSPGLHYLKVKSLLMESVSATSGTTSKTVSGGILDVTKAMACVFSICNP